MNPRHEIYRAPAIKRSWGSFFWNLAKRLFFPPLLLWDFTKFFFNFLFGKKISYAFVHAMDLTRYQYDKNHMDLLVELIQMKGLLKAKHLTVITADGVALDTLELEPKEGAPQGALLHFFGSQSCCEDLVQDYEEDARALNCKVVAFNLRGVRESSGHARASHDLVMDGIAQVQRLMDQGMHPEDITLKGYSLGGAIATLVAAHFHERGQKINLFSDRSFSSVTNHVVAVMRAASYGNGHEESFGGKILGAVVRPLIKFALCATQWEMDVASAWKKIPATHKEMMVIRSSKEDRANTTLGVADDINIRHYASLYAADKAERRALKKAIDKALKELDPKNSTTLTSEALERASRQLKEAKASLKDRKMTYVNDPSYPAHLCKPGELRGRHSGISGTDFFRNFVRRTREYRSLDAAKRNPGNIK